MNDVLNALFTRTSCRSFTSVPVSKEDLSSIVKAGQSAPSGMGRRQWHFTVITSGPEIEKLGRQVYGEMEQYFYGAKALILLSYQEQSDFALQDTGCAMEAMMVAATSLGLGSVWCNGVVRAKAFHGRLGIPEHYKPTASLAVGYPASGLIKKPYPVDNVSFVE